MLPLSCLPGEGEGHGAAVGACRAGAASRVFLACALEPAVSTMETQSIAGVNVALLAAQEMARAAAQGGEAGQEESLAPKGKVEL